METDNEEKFVYVDGVVRMRKSTLVILGIICAFVPPIFGFVFAVLSKLKGWC